MSVTTWSAGWGGFFGGLASAFVAAMIMASFLPECVANTELPDNVDCGAGDVLVHDDGHKPEWYCIDRPEDAP